MLAAEIEGQDGQGKGKLVGLHAQGGTRGSPRILSCCLSRVIPLQVDHTEMEPEKRRTTYKTVEEVKRELASRGISMEFMFKIMTAEPEPMDDEAPDRRGDQMPMTRDEIMHALAQAYNHDRNRKRKWIST